MSQAFFYVDGLPTKGMWIDLDETRDLDEVLEQLANGGYIPRDEDGDPDYDEDDLRVANVEGALARLFYNKHSDTFGMDSFKEVQEECDDEDAAVAYLSNTGFWSKRDFQDTYQGKWDDEAQFAQSLLDDTGELAKIPGHLQMYFDYKAFARDLFISDYTFIDGYVFRS